jgi:hypothetical protein
MADPKAETESLLNAALPFAQKMLKEHGEFYPYAFTLRADGTMAMVAGYDGREKPPSLDCTISSVGDHPVSSVEDHLIS